MSANMAIPGLVKISVDCKKDYDIMISPRNFDRVTQTILHLWSYTKACHLKHFYKRNYHNFNFNKDLTRETSLEWCSWLKLNNLGLPLVMVLTLYSSVAKMSKLKVR